MKDKVKAILVDAALDGQELIIVRRYYGWAIATLGPWGSKDELFNWRETYEHPRPKTPTLKQALEMVDAFWDDRVEMPAL